MSKKIAAKAIAPKKVQAKVEKTKVQAKVEASKPEVVKASTKVEVLTVKSPTGRNVKFNLSHDAREKIKGGITFDGLWAVFQKDWNLPDTKKWYVSWYFSESVRKGYITAEQRQIAKGVVPDRRPEAEKPSTKSKK